MCRPTEPWAKFTDDSTGSISIESIILVIRLLRVARVARKMDHFAEYSGVVLILLVGAFVLFGHWLACMWFAIGKCVHLFPGNR